MRNPEFDIMKGFLIIFVVVGHAIGGTIVHNIIYWFHMPAFFMISGFFIKTPKVNPFRDKLFWLKYINKYVIPYFVYSAIFFVIFQQESVVKNIVRVLYAGGNNISYYSYPYWYINTLFVSVLAIRTLIFFLNVRSKWLILCSVSIILQIIVHMPIYPFQFPLPWGIDLMLGAFTYLVIGYSFSRYTFKKWHLVILIIPLCMIYCEVIGKLNYQFNMRNMLYENVILDIIVPCSFTYMLYVICILVKHIPCLNMFLSSIGKSSLVVFFTHAAVIYYLKSWFNLPVFIIVLIALIGGYIVSKLASANNVSSFLLLGK